jgi:hypothetical protein
MITTFRYYYQPVGTQLLGGSLRKSYDTQCPLSLTVRHDEPDLDRPLVCLDVDVLPSSDNLVFGATAHCSLA